MSNQAYPGDLKIGQTRNDPEERRKDLGSTGVLHDYNLEYRALSEDYESLEREIHRSLAKQRVRINKEFFTISVPEAINKIREIGGDRIESDRVFYVSPEDLLRAEEEKKKALEEARARIEESNKKRKRIAEEERKQKLKESLQKLEAITAKKKAEESEKLRIEKEKESEKLRIEKEKEKELLEKYKNIVRPPKNILLFPFWVAVVPIRWAMYGIDNGPRWKWIFYIPVGIIGSFWTVVPFVGVIILLEKFLNFIGMG
jgi:hypothetical protein